MAERFNDDDDLMHDVLDATQGKENAPGDRSSYTEGMAALPDIKGPLNDNDLAELNRQAHQNYQIKLSRVKEQVIYKPNMDTFYYNQARAFITNVPKDLRLEEFLAQYNKVRRLTAIRQNSH